MNTDLSGDILGYIKDRFGGQPEYLWVRTPDACAVRRQDNKKWYALFMTVGGDKLGLPDSSPISIMNVKCDPLMAGSLRCRSGILPAYHMNKNSWITILLDGSVPAEEIFPLVDMSYGLAGGSGKARSTASGKKSWLVPANPAYYDLEQDFQRDGMINWKQTGKVSAGDDVFIYMAAPVSAVIYRCEVIESDIPYVYNGKNVSMKKVMKLRLIRRYSKELLSREKLKAHGVSAVRSARYMPESLLREINAILEDNNE